MCGIGGVMVYPKIDRTADELTFIKELVTNIAKENQARGSHATGVAVFGKKGHDVLKHNVSADELITYATYWNFLDNNINQDTYNILVHTRHATKGEPSNNDNNHPIVSATAIGVHNGWVNNDDELFAKENLYRLAQVDSEVIFRLADKELGNDMEHIKSVAEKLSGIYAVAYVKKHQPHILNWFRSSNPTTFAYIPDLNITVYASVEKYVKDAIAEANIATYFETGFSISEADIQYFSPTYNTIMQFDVTENTPIQQLEQKPLIFEDNDSWYYGTTYGYSKYYQGGTWYDEDWYYDRSGKTEEVEVGKPTNIYEFIEDKELHLLMSAEDYSELIEFLDQSEKNEWTKGYQAGRKSTDNDMKLIKEQLKNQPLDNLA
jgi:glucosamine 6-phosphate synthetase-like amidotransferase/phosphosugar isomerase protein